MSKKENFFITKETDEKNMVLNRAMERLKKEFIGIDQQIEDIINNLRTWYLFPELQTTPLIINLWGMTGCGKTSLVRRIASLLDLEEDLVYFNFASVSESNSYEIETKIEDELSNEKPNRIFCYDEFQYAATLNENHEEKDNKVGLKPFWELLDTGMIHKRFSYWLIGNIRKLAYYLTRINSKSPIQLKDGVWINERECMSNFGKYDLGGDVTDYINMHKFGEDGVPKKDRYVYDKTEEGKDETEWWLEPTLDNFIIDEDFVKKIADIYHSIHPDSPYGNQYSMYLHLREMPVSKICEELEDIAKEANKGYDLKFNESVIFVLGNLDEAYEMAFNVNPDMSADQFHEISKKISVVDVKNALESRFRNEQIARLGNIHLIYPSFSKKSFQRIIDLNLDKYRAQVKEKANLEFKFKDSIKDLIYDESVFPTHGTRPIISTIQEMIKTKLPDIGLKIFKDELVDADTAEFSYDGKKVVISIYGKKSKLLGTIEYNERLRVHKLRESKKDDMQALVAVHESGHFVLYAKYYGKLPEKLCSQSASRSMGGFMMEKHDDSDISSRRVILQDIEISLAGFVAEKLVFGEDERSNGASSDLSRATKLAVSYVRKWGMGDNPYVTTFVPDGQNSTSIFSGSGQSNEDVQAARLIKYAIGEVENILKSYQWNKMFVASSKYLAENSTMPKEKMEEIYNLVSESERSQARTKDYYRNCVDRL